MKTILWTFLCSLSAYLQEIHMEANKLTLVPDNRVIMEEKAKWKPMKLSVNIAKKVTQKQCPNCVNWLKFSPTSKDLKNAKSLSNCNFIPSHVSENFREITGEVQTLTTGILIE